MKTELFTISNCKVKARTLKAVLIELDGDIGDHIWLPLSQVHEIDEDAGTVVVSQWVAKERGLL